VNASFCLDRDCAFQSKGPHYHQSGKIYSALDFPGVNKELEEIKKRRGYKCWECSKWLIPTDKDHSFCNTCWYSMLAHPFIPDELEMCKECDERKDSLYHGSVSSSS